MTRQDADGRMSSRELTEELLLETRSLVPYTELTARDDRVAPRQPVDEELIDSLAGILLKWFRTDGIEKVADIRISIFDSRSERAPSSEYAEIEFWVPDGELPWPVRYVVSGVEGTHLDELHARDDGTLDGTIRVYSTAEIRS